MLGYLCNVPPCQLETVQKRILHIDIRLMLSRETNDVLLQKSSMISCASQPCWTSNSKHHVRDAHKFRGLIQRQNRHRSPKKKRRSAHTTSSTVLRCDSIHHPLKAHSPPCNRPSPVKHQHRLIEPPPSASANPSRAKQLDRQVATTHIKRQPSPASRYAEEQGKGMLKS